MTTTKPYDVMIVGGGPAGLSAALALGRGRKRVLLSDFGPRRNAAAQHIHNFVTRDGTPPDDFRRTAREQLKTYPNVEVRDEHIDSVTGSKGAFGVVLGTQVVQARRVLLSTGMIDEPLAIEGFRELWGRAIFQCPYCHGWEVQDRAWGYLGRGADSSHFLPFALLLRGWTSKVVAFTNGEFEIAEPDQLRLKAAGVRVETAPVTRIAARDHHLEAVELADGTRAQCEVLFAHPPQRQIDLVRTLAPVLDDVGFVRVDPMTRETSIPGIYAAGDLTTRMQGAIFAAASGTHAGTVINMELTMELAPSGAL